MRPFQSALLALPQLSASLTPRRRRMWMMTAMMFESIVVAAASLMLLLIILLLLWACKPWRFFLSPPHHPRTITVGDLERPLISDDLDRVESQSDESRRINDIEGSRIQIDGHLSSSGHGLVRKQRLPSVDAHVTQGPSVVVDVISDPPDDSLVGQTLKRPLAFNRWLEENKSARKEGHNHESSAHSFSNYQESVPKDNSYQKVQETALSLKLYLDHHAGFAVPFNQQRLLDSH